MQVGARMPPIDHLAVERASAYDARRAMVPAADFGNSGDNGSSEGPDDVRVGTEGSELGRYCRKRSGVDPDADTPLAHR